MNEVYTYHGFTGVKIGDLFWMNKNLDIGEGINNPDHPEFGKYYTWDQAMKAIPDGWRMPSIEDWYQLQQIVYYDNKLNLKHDDYRDHDIDPINKLNFNAIPSGEYHNEGKGGFFDKDSSRSYWWTSSEDIYDDDNAKVIRMMFKNGEYYRNGSFDSFNNYKRYRYTVRCVQDWNIVKDYINQNQDIDNIELDNLDNLNESIKFFRQSERFL
jgi:uncharacterized protein (TIGR02145 family)